MEFIKNNQCLKIRVAYDQDYGQIAFDDFIGYTGLERLSDWEWLKFVNPEAMHFAPDDLRTPTSVFDALDEVSLCADEFTMPALTEEEFTEIFSLLVDGDVDSINLEVARRGLLSMSHLKWYESLNRYNDLRDILAPYTYSARGYSQGDVAHLYLIGMDEHEAESLTKEFAQYAFDTPYRYGVELIDCETGETIADDSCGGIYDDTCDLDYLKHELSLAIKCLGRIDEELLSLALEEVQALDYTSIDN